MNGIIIIFARKAFFFPQLCSNFPSKNLKGEKKYVNNHYLEIISLNCTHLIIETEWFTLLSRELFLGGEGPVIIYRLQRGGGRLEDVNCVRIKLT